MTLYWIYDIPNSALGVLLVATWIAVGNGGLLLTRHMVARMWSERTQNEIVSFFLAALGVFYGITLGLIAVGAWENYQRAGDHVDEEAAAISSLWYDVSAYPEPQRARLRADLRGFTHAVIDSAWPAQSHGAHSEADARWIANLQADLDQFNPATAGQAMLGTEALTAFNALVRTRTLRAQQADGGLPPVVWWVVILGGLLNIALTWLFVIRPLSAHMLLTGSLSALVGLLIFLIAAMDHPLRGEVSISSTPYQDVFTRLMTQEK